MENKLCFGDLCPKDAFLPQEIACGIPALKLMQICKEGRYFEKLPEEKLIKQDGRNVSVNAHSNGTYFFVPADEPVIHIMTTNPPI